MIGSWCGINKSCNLHDEWRVLLLRKRPLGHNFTARRSTVLMVMVRYRSSVLALYVIYSILYAFTFKQINHFTQIVVILTFSCRGSCLLSNTIKQRNTEKSWTGMMTRLLKTIQTLLFQVGSVFFVNRCAAGREARCYSSDVNDAINVYILVSSMMHASFCRYVHSNATPRLVAASC